MRRATILALAFLIVLAMQATAIGVTPALNTINYKDGERHTIDFTVVNTENRTLKVALIPQGEIPLEPDTDVAELKPLEARKMSYSFTMPSNLESGTRSGSILVQEVPEDATNSITATAAVITALHVKVPYTGKQIAADVGTRPEERKVNFVIAVTNMGTETINSLNAEINVLGETITTPTTSLEPEKRTDLETAWTAPRKGKYQAAITIEYDDKKKNLIQEFNTESSAAAYYSITPDSETPKKSKSGKLWITIAVIVLVNAYFIARRLLRKPANP